MKIQNTIIRASAGSGKTFKLSSRYIALLLDGKPAEKILASTFTVKAADEILSRILQRLSAAALAQEKNDELRDSLQRDFGKEFTVPDKKKLQSITAELARNLYRVQISTLDSFFNRIASAFGLELELPPVWTILEDDAFSRLLQEAVRNVLKEHSGEVSNLLHLLNEGESTLTVTKELVDLAKNYLPLMREVQDQPELWGKGLPFRKIEEKTLGTPENILSQTVFTKDINRSNNGIQNLCRSVAAGNWQDVISHTLIQNVLTEKVNKKGEITYCSNPIEGELLRTCKKLGEYSKTVIINKLIGKTKATGKLLALIAEQCDTLLYRSGAYRFEDITEKVCRASVENKIAPSMLSHRLDSAMEYLMLDEFQDTSLPQWKILEPFANTAEKSGSVFVVGDVKQAIYAFRGGVAEIFQTVKSKIKSLQEQELATSYRSAQAVIDTVNTVFDKIENNSAVQDGKNDDEIYPKAASGWKNGFEKHRTAKTFSGCCSLELIPTEDGDDENDADEKTGPDGDDDSGIKPDKFITEAAKRIKKLHEDKPLASIGVLVRNNKMISTIISALKIIGVEASEEGGNPLPFDSAAVRIVLSALLLADHPGDTAARFHVADSPLAEYCGLTEYHSNIKEGKHGKYDGDKESADWSRRIRRKMSAEDLESVVKELSAELNRMENLQQHFPREWQRLEQLSELAMLSDIEAKEDRLRRFVEKVKTAKISGKSEKGKITATTIHKSKGLEYDIVVLPELNVPLVKGTPKLIISRKNTECEPVGPVDFIIRYTNEKTQGLLPKNYRDAFAERIRSEIVQSLNLLYVAITRAKRELLILVPHKTGINKKGESTADKHTAKTFGNVLLKGLVPEWQEDVGVVYQNGNINWYKEFEKKTIEEISVPPCLRVPQKELPEKLTLPTEPKRRSFLRLTPSGIERQTVKPSVDEAGESEKETEEITETNNTGMLERFSGSRSEAQLCGTAVHKCFEYTLNQNPYLETIPDKDELLQNCQNAETKNLNWDEITEKFAEMCRNENVRKVLSRSAYPADEEIETEHERRFIVKVKDGKEDKIVNGIIDRLIIRRKNGKVAGLEIIDFKSDGEFRNKMYKPQMQIYRKAAAKLYGIPESNISVKLLYVSLGQTVEV